MTLQFIKRNQYNNRQGIDFKDESRTQQQFKAECDVNRRIEQLTRHLDMTGQTLEEYNSKGAMYGDFTQIPDFITYNQIVCDAKEKFDALPVKVRERFGNSPERLFEFILDENNRDEAAKLGLLEQPLVKDIKQDISTPNMEIDEPSERSSDVSDTPINS